MLLKHSVTVTIFQGVFVIACVKSLCLCTLSWSCKVSAVTTAVLAKQLEEEITAGGGDTAPKLFALSLAVRSVVNDTSKAGLLSCSCTWLRCHR